MKQIKQLQEILCTVESVEKDVKELKFWTKIMLKDFIEEKTINYWYDSNYYEFYIWLWKKYSRNDIDKIIWNPLQERHLRMYLEAIYEKRMDEVIESCPEEKYIWNYVDYGLRQLQYKLDAILNNQDHKKELYEQEDKVLLDIINFLKG